MAYIQSIYKFNNSIEYEYYFNGKYGAKGEKRAKRKSITPDQMQRQNQHNKIKKVKRLIKANFNENDLFITLKYPKGQRKELQNVQKDIRNYIAKLRRAYKKTGKELKFIYRLEIGARGGIHSHIIINNIENAFILFQELWTHGRVNIQKIYSLNDFEVLAEYITKKPTEEAYKQLCLFPEEEQKHFIKYSCSKNLIKPMNEKKIYSHWTLRKLLEEGIKPNKGYYIDHESIKQGINPYNGKSYLYYTEIRIRQENKLKYTEKHKKKAS